MSKKITPAERRHEDYLRRQGLKTGAVYMKRLLTLRRQELDRVLKICRQYDDVGQWGRVIDENLAESGYLYDWYKGLYLSTGMPQARSVTRDLTRSKASDPGPVWEQALTDYATRRAGENITIVTNTYKNAVRAVLRDAMVADINQGVETLARRLKNDIQLSELWQCRRIAQTETMISLAEGANEAAVSLDIRFTKQWCISGIGNTRDTHKKMDGKMVDEKDYFDLGDCLMRYPHDDSLKPPAEEIINCACACIRRPK